MRDQLCVRCGFARWIPILYGYPAGEAFEAAERGELEIGGCAVREGWNRRCRVCRLIEGEPPDWDAMDGPTDGEFREFHRPLSADLLDELNKTVRVEELALSFDGYAALGDEIYPVVAAAAKAFSRTGRLPTNLVILRTCLFFEQRGAHHRGDGMDRPYIHALVESLRPWVRPGEAADPS